MRGTTLISLLFAITLSGCAGLSAESAQREAGQARLAKAEAMFQERSETAGEFRYCMAEDVESVRLLKLRLSRWRVAA